MFDPTLIVPLIFNARQLNKYMQILSTETTLNNLFTHSYKTPEPSNRTNTSLYIER
jgi:uncharacterized protein VirK/YbjX